MREGLYITLTPDGKIKRHLSSEMGEMPLEDTTITDELIHLSEQNHVHMYQVIKEIWAYAGVIDMQQEYETVFAFMVESFLRYLREKEPVRYTLLMTQLDDQPYRNPFARCNSKEVALFIANILSQAMAADITVNRVLATLSEDHPIDLEGDHFMLFQSKAIVCFTLNDTLTTEYQFRSEEQYYIFLLQHFVLLNPKVTVCRYCGRYFIPKTKKKTLYCDRIVRDGKTCKQIAPHLNRKERAATDRVIATYLRTKDMLLHRLGRMDCNKKSSPIDLTLEEYFQWLEKATAARDCYIAGKISAEEAIRIIHVPTIQELRENHVI